METTCRAGNLPAEISSFVGRSKELGEIARLIAGSPLLTLTGIAGVGKTRLAIEAGAGCAPPDGVWFADLSGRPPADPGTGAGTGKGTRDTRLAEFVAASLGIDDRRHPHEALAEWLAGKRLLLILDSCDALPEPCRDLVRHILATAPGVRLLVTGRGPLGVDGERVRRVEPLPVPPPGATDICRYDAVRLLTDRATAVLPGFRCTEAVGRLCRAVEGVPLAIELAARRLRALSAEQLAARVRGGLDAVLGAVLDGRRPGRHRSLRAAAGWSHERCDPRERLLWARLSVFADTFGVCSATAICSGGPLGDVRGTLAGLVAKSVVTRTAIGRYRLPRLNREYGAMWLRGLGAEADLRRRHYDHYREAAESAAAQWQGPAQLDWADWARRELADLRAALDHTIGERRGLELAARLWFVWLCLGRIKEGRRYLDEALARTTVPCADRSRALWVSAWLALSQGHLTAAQDRAAAALHTALDQRDDVAAGAAVHVTAVLALIRGELARAESLIMESLNLFGRADDMDLGLPLAQATLGLILGHRGDLDRAVRVLNVQQAWCERYGETWARSYGDYVRSQVELRRGDIDAAERFDRRSLAAKWRFGDLLGQALAVDQMAAIAAARGDGERSARLLGTGQRIWTTFGRPQFGAPAFALPRHTTERRARSMIGDALYEAAFTSGAATDPCGVPD